MYTSITRFFASRFYTESNFHRVIKIYFFVFILNFIFSNFLVSAALASISSVSEMGQFVGKKVETLDISGNKRIEKDAILNKLTIKAGKSTLTSESIRADIQSVYSMGFFDDIEWLAQESSGGIQLTLKVHERPVISKITFEGNEKVSTSDLEDVVKVKQWSIFDVNKIREDVGLIQKHYEDKGFYLAKVNFEIIQAESDQVELNYKINDFEKVQIKKITFLNNKNFSDAQLKAVLMETREGNMWSFMNNSGNFKENSFKQDLQRLTYWYLDNGFVKFKYENPVVTVSDDKRWLYITIYVDEGDVFSMKNFDFGGDLLFSKEELHSELTLKPDATFSISKRNADIQRLTEKYQDLGFAFTNVIPKMNIDEEKKTVDIQYDFEKGNLVYFGEINVVGNSKTHDKVIRRELRIAEGELYSGTRMRLSRENVERLGYFNPGEVVFNTITRKGSQDILDVEISIKERSTGSVTLGAGYGNAGGFFFQTQVSEINLLGRGQSLSLTGIYSTGSRNRSFNLGFTEPYFLDTRLSTGFDIFYLVLDSPGAPFERNKLGFDIRLGYTIYPYTNAYVTYKLEDMNIIRNAERARTLSASELADVDSDEGILSSIVWSVIRDKRNNRYETTDGTYQSISLETAGLGGDKEFLKWGANTRFYRRFFGDFVFRHTLEYGQIQGLSGKRTPFGERFFLGGPNNLKGFFPGTVGPGNLKSNGARLYNSPTGGTVQAFGVFEVEHPLIREAGLKFVGFFDVGNAWDGLPAFDDFTIRADWGFGLRWFSPIGPLRFEWGFPVRPKPWEDSMYFSFYIGPPF